MNTSIDTQRELFNKKYKSDEVFKKISTDFVSLRKHDITINNLILKQIIKDVLIERMKKADSYFKELFKGLMYGGSFFKGLKVSKPDEYDLNLVIGLPDKCLDIETEDAFDNPGYVKIRFNGNDAKGCSDIWSKILDNNHRYVDQNKFRNWIHSVLDKALKTPQNGNYIIRTRHNIYKISYGQSNPAFTIHTTMVNGDKIDFDLVPCLTFDNQFLQGFRQMEANAWITIAKPLRGLDIDDSNLWWRAGFYSDERMLLKGHIKSIIKMIKRFRDVRGWINLKSYFIETIFLHELNNTKFCEEYPKASRTCIFIYILKRLLEVLKSGYLYSYWCPRLDLFNNINKQNLNDVANELKRILNRIDYEIEENPNIIWMYFTNTE